MSETLLATYNSIETANRVVSDLVSAGFDRSKIGLAAQDANGEFKRHLDARGTTTAVTEDVSGGEGAGFGAVVGTLIGAVAGLVAITVPGIGAIIAAGPLAALGGAAAGAGIGALTGGITGGLTASLVDMGVSEEDAGHYAESVRRGGALVSLTVQSSDVQRATDILHSHNPIDLDQRATQWRASGWKGFDPMADPYTAVDNLDHVGHEDREEATNIGPDRMASGSIAPNAVPPAVRRYTRTDGDN